MSTRHLIIVFLAAALTASGAAMADSIYKWTDEDGNVHYEDRPSGAESEERMALTYTRTDSDAVEQRIKTQLDGQDVRREERSAAAEEAKKGEAALAEAAQRQKACDSYRGKLESLTQARRLYREDENGERVYLDDDARMEARQRTEDLVQKFCNS